MRRLALAALLLAAPAGARAFTDDFNRADASTLGANWTDYTTYSWGVVSNAAQITGNSFGLGWALYTGETAPSDQYAQVRVASLPAGSTGGVSVRMTGNGTSGYAVQFGAVNQLSVYTSGSRTWIAGCSGIVAGDTVRIVASGSTISVYRWNVSTSTPICTATDSTYTSGQPGLYMEGAGAGTMPSLDDFEAISAAPTAAAPTASPAAGSFTTAQSVTLSCTSPSPTIRYTTDGSTPTGSSPVYSSAIAVPVGRTTVKAICQSSGLADSSIASFDYSITPITYVGAGTAQKTAAGTTLTIQPTIPAGQAGDLVVCPMHSFLNAAITCTANCGSPAFSEVVTQIGGTSYRWAVWYRFLQSGEAGAPPTPTFSQTGTANTFLGQCFVFRGVDTTTPFDVKGSMAQESATTTWTGDALTTVTDGAIVVFTGASQDDNTWGTWGGSVSAGAYAVSAANTNDDSVFLAYGPATDAGLQVAPTAVQLTLGADAGRSLTFALRPLVVSSGGASVTLPALTMTAGQTALTVAGGAASTTSAQAMAAGLSAMSATGGAASSLSAQATVADVTPMSAAGGSAAALLAQALAVDITPLAVSTGGGVGASATLSSLALTAGFTSLAATGGSASSLVAQSLTVGLTTFVARGASAAALPAQNLTAALQALATAGSAAANCAAQAMTATLAPLAATGGSGSNLPPLTIRVLQSILSVSAGGGASCATLEAEVARLNAIIRNLRRQIPATIP